MMIFVTRSLRSNRSVLVIIATLLVFSPLLTTIYKQHVDLSEKVVLIPSNDTQYERFCREVSEKIKNEHPSNTTVQLHPHKKSIPYYYSTWRSSPLMPRAITECEHAIYMHLLSILIEKVFKKYGISYMMMAATLLGSYTSHDMLPWDDDIDIAVSISDRYRLQSIIIGELSSEPYSIIIMQLHNERNYDKVFFSWCPHAGNTPWRFPFIDIFYQDRNSSHVWLSSKPSSCPVLAQDIYPLVLRPLGSLWLYSPREPMAHFESRKMRNIETGCYMFPYSHKYEKLTMNGVLSANCTKLKSIYPFVERMCFTNRCLEHLKIGNRTIIQAFISNYPYRTFLYAERNNSFKAC